MSPSNEPLIYDLSGDTFFAIANDTGSIFDVYTNKVKTVINDFNTLLYNNNMTVDFYKTNTSTIQSSGGTCAFSTNGTDVFFGDCEDNRFYILMSQLYLNTEYLTTLVNDLTSGPEIKSNSQLVEKIKRNFKEQLCKTSIRFQRSVCYGRTKCSYSSLLGVRRFFIKQ
jgi:hypothetical protein